MNSSIRPFSSAAPALLIAAIAGLLAVGPMASANSEIHSWRDADGNLHFGDAPPEAGSAQDLKVVELKGMSEYKSVPLPERVAADPRDNAAAEPVVMYSTSWCGYCKKARRYFNANGIAYRERDIERSNSAKRSYDKLGVSGVPVILQGDRQMRGFSVNSFQNFYQP